MTESSLQDRLRDHSKAFDGLLSLIPAKMYYGEDTSDQWQRKKQTKAEAAAARRGRLDPDSAQNRNAKQVMDERAQHKRKLRELQGEDDDQIETGDDEEDEEMDHIELADGVDAEQPGQGLRKRVDEPNKKPKLQNGDVSDNDEESVKLSKKEEKQLAKKEKKKAKKAEKKVSQAPAEQQNGLTPPSNLGPSSSTNVTAAIPKQAKAEKKKLKDKTTTSGPLPSQVVEIPLSDVQKQEDEAETEEEAEAEAEAQDGKQGLKEQVVFPVIREDDDPQLSAAESGPQSPTFDTSLAPADSAEPASTTTSVSSTIPPSEKPKHIRIPADTSLLKQRLAAKIEALRAARKADGSNGKPIRTRQELIESRRVKAAERKAHKKELRKQSKLEEARKREEALASNSPGMMSPAVELDEAAAGGSFSFGRVAFGDGAQLSRDLDYVLNKKKKGPTDPKTALQKVQSQKKRLDQLEPDKREDIAEKDTWLSARRRAEGDKIRDDEATLKKAVKRKDTAKKKSEKAWKDRVKGVEQAQKDRQKKREDNLRKRKEDKMLGKAGKKKKGKKGGAAAAVGGAKKKGRPGFEGSLGVSRRK